MPEFVNGLPLHALVVHAVVVLVPLAVLGAIVISVWPAARRRFGWLVVACAAVATALVPIATDSGEDLERRVGASPDVKRHEELGDLMLWFVLPLFVAVLAMMVLQQLQARQLVDERAGGPGTQTAPRAQLGWVAPVIVVLAVLTVALAVATGVHVFRVGEAGAKAVWGGVQNLPVK